MPRDMPIASAIARSAAGDGQSDLHKSATILLVEDEPAVRRLFADALVRAGYQVLEARNGREALVVSDQYGGHIDLLLTDMRMPYLGGAELSLQVRDHRPTIGLIYISDYPDELESELSGDSLAKPFTQDDLLTKVRDVLTRHSRAS